jgi:hypothetical protein
MLIPSAIYCHPATSQLNPVPEGPAFISPHAKNDGCFGMQAFDALISVSDVSPDEGSFRHSLGLILVIY